MGDKSKIEWTNATWNPTTGCTKITSGCANCYALPQALRMKAIGVPAYANGFDLTLQPDRLDIPLRWKRPRKIFVNSMSDLFHKDVPTEFIQKVFAVMAQAHWHTFQVLTKRADRVAAMADMLPWPPNVLMGVSVESAQVAWRVDELRKVPAAVRFLSCEPLIGSVGALDLTGIGWVIAGGESGPNARLVRADWLRELRDLSAAAGADFFFKQWGQVVEREIAKGFAYGGGELFTGPDGDRLIRVGSKTALPAILDGQKHLAFPKVLA